MEPDPQTILVSWTGADWRWLQPMLDAGEMPVLAGLIARGVACGVRGFAPFDPGMLAASLATGLPPDLHGVFGAYPGADGRPVPIGLAARRGRAMWDDFAGAGRRIGVVGWPGIFPAEPVPGIWVADAWARGSGSDTPEGAIHPPDAAAWLEELRCGPRELDPGLLGLLVPEGRELGRADDPRAGRLAEHLARLYTLHNAAVAVLGRERPGFFTVYHGFLGDVAREFGVWHPPRHPSLKTADFALYRDVLRGAARLQDVLLGDLLAHAEPGARVMVVSPWGWATGAERPAHLPVLTDAVEAWRARPGICVASGPGVSPARVLPTTALLDVTPTLLAWCGLPAAGGREGRVLAELFADGAIATRLARPESPHPTEDVKPEPVASPDFSREPDALSADHAWALGRALRDLGRPADAVPWLQWAWLTEPENAARASELAQAFLQLLWRDEAEAPIAAVLDRGGDTTAARFLRAWRAGVGGEWAEAEAAVAELGDSPTGRALRAELCLRTARAGEAREIWREQILREPGHLRAWLGLAQAALALGAPKEAEEALARLRVLLPGAKEIARLEACLRAQSGTRAGAMEPGPVDWSGRMLEAEARAGAATACRERAEVFFAARRTRRGAVADALTAPGDWRMRAPEDSERVRLDKHFIHGARMREQTTWCRVIVAGREERLVGLVGLLQSSASSSAEEPAAGADVPRRALVLEMCPGWEGGEASGRLLEAAWTQALAERASELTLNGKLGPSNREWARALGFECVLRKELRSMPIGEALAWMGGPGSRLLKYQRLPIASVDLADPARVREICRATGLLGEDRVRPEAPLAAGGYDPGLSFFAGSAEAPLAVLLAREQDDGVYLEALARDPERPDGERAVTLALLHAFLRAAYERGHGCLRAEISPDRTRGIAWLTDRWHSEVVAVRETWRWNGANRDCDGKAGAR